MSKASDVRPISSRAEPARTPSLSLVGKTKPTPTSETSTFFPSQLHHAIKEEDSSRDFTVLFEKIYGYYVNGGQYLELPCPVELLDSVEHVVDCCARLLGKPRFAYLREQKLLIIRWPTDLHDAPLGTFIKVFEQDIGSLNPAGDHIGAIDVGLDHNTLLDGHVIPDLCLRFISMTRAMVCCPFICQIAVSETLPHVLDTIETVVENNPSVQMVVLLDVTEFPTYSKPVRDSTAWELFSTRPLQTLTEFIALSTFANQTDPSFAQPIATAQHVWCFPEEVDFYVWLRDPSGVLDIRQTDAETSAWGRMSNNFQMDTVEHMLDRGFAVIKNSFITFCQQVTGVANFPALQNHASTPGSWVLDTLRTKLRRGALLTAYARYKNWYEKSQFPLELAEGGSPGNQVLLNRL